VSEINSFGQFIQEITIPLWYTTGATALLGPPGLALTRRFIQKANLPGHFRLNARETPFSHFMQYLFRWGGPLPRRGDGLASRRTPFGHPVSMRSVDKEARGLALNRVPRDQRLSDPHWLEAVSVFRTRADAWAYQASPCALFAGALIGLVTPILTSDYHYLREEKFDWLAKTAMYLACTVFGSVSTWTGHNFMSAPLARWFVVKMGGTSFGYIIPYLFLPILTNAGMFFFQQVVFNMDLLAADLTGPGKR